MIRSPHLHEADALADPHLRTWEQTYGGRFPASAWGDEARAQRRRMRMRLRLRLRLRRTICAEPDRPGFRVAVTERDGQLIGFGGGGPNQDAAPPRPRQLHFLYLPASGQGSGVGQAPLDAVLGDDPASLWVLEGNARAIAFSARNRFTSDGTRQPTVFATDGDEIRMLR